jgi:enoyl-CoA hydratase/carnithine racemase
MTYNTLQYSVSDQILTLTLDRPDQLNSFTVEMANELIDAFTTASDDDSVKVIVVTGAGKAFCAGMDLSVDGNVFGLNTDLKPSVQDMHEKLYEPDIVDGVRDTGGRVTLAIYDCKKPVIAAINGAAVGIGATMTCAMDIRLASEKARVGFVFNKIGIVPEACSSWFLPRIVGISTALEWSYTGDIMDAQTLLAERFVRSVSKPEELLNDAYKLAEKISQHSAVALALTRQMMYRNSAKNHPVEAHRIDSLAMHHVSQHDGLEGVDSFLEKRAAKFTAKASSEMPDFYPWWD